VQFHEGCVITRGQSHIRQGAGEAGRGTPLVQRLAFLIAQLFARRFMQGTSQQPAPETADAKARRFLRSR
jgi:hypothetical protein